jgi:hypothetical protein
VRVWHSSGQVRFGIANCLQTTASDAEKAADFPPLQVDAQMKTRMQQPEETKIRTSIRDVENDSKLIQAMFKELINGWVGLLKKDQTCQRKERLRQSIYLRHQLAICKIITRAKRQNLHKRGTTPAKSILLFLSQILRFWILTGPRVVWAKPRRFPIQFISRITIRRRNMHYKCTNLDDAYNRDIEK